MTQIVADYKTFSNIQIKFLEFEDPVVYYCHNIFQRTARRFHCPRNGKKHERFFIGSITAYYQISKLNEINFSWVYFFVLFISRYDLKKKSTL